MNRFTLFTIKTDHAKRMCADKLFLTTASWSSNTNYVKFTLQEERSKWQSLNLFAGDLKSQGISEKEQ